MPSWEEMLAQANAQQEHISNISDDYWAIFENLQNDPFSNYDWMDNKNRSRGKLSGMGGRGGMQEGTSPTRTNPGGLLPTPDHPTVQDPIDIKLDTFQNAFNTNWANAIQDSFITDTERASIVSSIERINALGGSTSMVDYTNQMNSINENYQSTIAQDVTIVSGVQDIPNEPVNLGISNSAVGSRSELQGMLASYKSRTLNIQSPQRQKAIYVIDRFDGGLNLNKAARDLSYWEACVMNELTPSKSGRLVKLGDFSSGTTYSLLIADGASGATDNENYGLHYFRLSNEKDLGATGTPTNYFAYQDGADIEVWDFSDGTIKADVITSMGGEYISATEDRDFSSSSNWANAAGANAFNTYDESASAGATEGTYFTDNYLKVIPDEVGDRQYATLDGAYWEDSDGETGEAMVIGNTYRLSYSIEITAYTQGNLHVGTSNDSYVVQHSNSYAATTGPKRDYLDFTYDANDLKLIISANANTVFTAYFDNFSIRSIALPVYHDASNRLYVSDAALLSAKTYMTGIVDRRKLFPFDSSGTLTYNITGNSSWFTNQPLYHAPPTRGLGDGHIMVTGTQSDSTRVNSLTHLMNTAASSGGVQHHGIYININFEDVSEDTSGTGWGLTEPGGEQYYKIYASFLYDDGSETKLTDVTSEDNTTGSDDTIKATTTTTDGTHQELIVKQVIIDGAGMVASHSRVHGARFYYAKTDDSGNPIGTDKYLWAELDFRYGFKLVSEFGHWNQFTQDNAGSGHSQTTMIQVLNAANDGDDLLAAGTLSISAPPAVWTYYALNLFHQEELKDDLMWKTSTVGNGIAFIANIKYDGRQYTDTMLYSGAGEADSGSVYPMWGTFPVDSNRIDIPGTSGEITALQWTSNRILQFRKNALYIVNVEDVLAPKVEAVYQGMGVAGSWAVTETAFGVAWVNDKGVYAYNAEEKKARSLTIGRLDSEDIFPGTDAEVALTKIGYDDRAKMLIIGNYTKKSDLGSALAYSFVTDAWCTWTTNDTSYTTKSNWAINHDGYLTGAVQSSDDVIIRKWNAQSQVPGIIEYVTKDIDFGKPSLDKRLYTLYISYTGGTNQNSGDDLDVFFRMNGLEGNDVTLVSSGNGWTQIGTIFDVTNPYGANQGSAWGTSADGSTTLSGEAFIPASVDHLNSVDTGDVQKLAKINLRHLSNSVTAPDDLFKFARSIQFKISGYVSATFEINDISLVYKEKRLK